MLIAAVAPGEDMNVGRENISGARRVENFDDTRGVAVRVAAVDHHPV